MARRRRMEEAHVKIIWVAPLLLVMLLPALACNTSAQASSQNAAEDLRGTSWQLVKFQRSDEQTLAPDDKSKYTIAFGIDSQVNVRIDCNRGRGTWKSSGPNRLTLSPLALTRAMCPPAPLNDRMPEDLALVRSYTLKDGHLFLELMADAGIYELEPSGGSKSAAPSSPVSSKGPVEFECTNIDGSKATLTATFYGTRPATVLIERGNQVRPAFQVRSGSGAKYEGHDLMFWDAHGEAIVKWGDVELECKARR